MRSSPQSDIEADPSQIDDLIVRLRRGSIRIEQEQILRPALFALLKSP